MAVKELRFGTIDRQGKWLFRPCFEQLGVCSDGRLPFREGERWGFADLAGKVAVAAQYDFVHPFSGGAACVERDGQWTAIDPSGAPVDGWRGALVEGRVRACTGAWPSRTHREPTDAGARFGFLDASGEEVVPRQYAFASDFRMGLAVVKLVEEAATPGQGWSFAYLRLDGSVAIGPFKSWDARTFAANGLARRRCGSSWQFIGRDGEVVIDTGCAEVEPFAEGLAAVASPERKSRWGAPLRGYIDERGANVIDFRFEAAAPFASGLAAVTDRVGPTPLVGFVDPAGTLVIEHRFRRAHSFAGDVAPACVQDPQAYSRDVWGLVGRDGRWVVEPTLRGIRPFRDGAASFSRADGTCGLFDAKGQIIADGYAHFLHDGYPCAVNRGGKWSKNGEKLTGGKWGFVDAHGQEIVACTHDAIGTGFSADVAAVGDKIVV